MESEFCVSIDLLEHVAFSNLEEAQNKRENV